MLRYLLQRLGISLVVLFGLSVLAFTLVRLVPGDTASAMLGIHYTEEAAAALRDQYGLDKPVFIQYGLWVANIFRGDLGTAVTGRPVTAELGAALPVTLELVAISLTFAVLVGVPLGMVAAVKRNEAAEHAASLFGLLGLSVPGFWLGTLMILLFALHLGWLPSGQYVPWTQDPVANLRHMLLPGVALGTAVAAVVLRITRMSMVEVLHQDYIRTAVAKGLSPRTVLVKHALRNGLIPILTIVGIQAGYLLGGSVVIEAVFSLNGIGQLVLRSIGNRDYALLQAAILLIGAWFLAINLAVDLLYGLADPRVRQR